MNETEIRAIVADPAGIQKRLCASGFQALGTASHQDIILDRPDTGLFRSGRKVRVRVAGRSAELTYKGPFEGDSEASRREEISVVFSVDQVDNLIRIFNVLDFPVCLSVSKIRTELSGNGLKITFDEWPIIGCVMEVEGDEEKARALVDAMVPGVRFGNYRLKDFFKQAEINSGLSLADLKRLYEESRGVSLGRLEVMLQ